MNVTINREELLERLQKHRERYEESFKALLENYKKQAAKYQKEYAKYVEKTKGMTFGPMAPMEPKNRVIDYNFYIKMIEAHRENTIELTETEFRKLWMDLWDWIYQHISELRAGDSGLLAAFAATYEEVSTNL